MEEMKLCPKCKRDLPLGMFLKYPRNKPSISNPTFDNCRTCYWQEHDEDKSKLKRRARGSRLSYRWHQEGHT